MDIPEQITCVECGGPCGRLTPQPEDGFAPGDVVAYRCADCGERLDVEVPEDPAEA